MKPGQDENDDPENRQNENKRVRLSAYSSVNLEQKTMNP